MDNELIPVLQHVKWFTWSIVSSMSVHSHQKVNRILFPQISIEIIEWSFRMLWKCNSWMNLISNKKWNFIIRTKIQNRSAETADLYGKPSGVAIQIKKATNITKKVQRMKMDRLNKFNVGIRRPHINNARPYNEKAISKSGFIEGSERPCIGMNMSNEKMV